MIKHIIPDDTYNHIDDPSCWCNPQLCNSEGEVYYVHNTNYIEDIETKDREESFDFDKWYDNYLIWKRQTSTMIW